MDKWLTKRTMSRVKKDGEGSSTPNRKPSKQGKATGKLEESEVSERQCSHIIKTNEKAVCASYHISLRIAKAGEPPTSAESFLLPLMKDIFEIMLGEKVLKEVEAVPLSSDTVAHRIDEMSQWVEDLLIQRVRKSKFFSLQLDDSSDVEELCHLLVFVRYIWNNELHEDLLCCEPVLRSTSEEIFQTLNTYIKRKGLDWMKCVGICTDGARALCGKNSSVVTQVLEVCPNASWTHCSLHREALVSKSMSDNLRNVLKTSIEIVNFMKTSLLQSHLFEQLCEEMGSTHETLLLHTEARWLSKGKVLTRLVEHREEIATILDDKSDLAKWLRDEEFILELAYLAEMISKLNELNLYLRGTDGADIFAAHDKIQAFIKKLVLWKENIENRKCDCFETFVTFVIGNEEKLTDGIITEISTHLSALKENFDYYFSEEMNNCQQKNWIVNPYQDNMMTGISIKADDELIDMSSNLALKLKFNRRKLAQFWLSVQQTFPTLSAEALKVLLLFFSSNLCEVGFSAMIGIENRSQSNLQLLSYLRLQITNIDVDVNAVINWNQVQPSHTSQYE